MRVLKWIVDRAHGRTGAKETPIGWIPRYTDIDWNSLEFTREQFEPLQLIDRTAWRVESIEHQELLMNLHDHLPSETTYERERLPLVKLKS